MPDNFQEKVVVITGAGSGIGRAVAMAFAAQGARVCLADIDKDGLEEVEAAIAQTPGRAWAYVVDVADRAAMRAFGEQVVEDHGAPDILFNNAGVAVHGSIADTSLDDWDWLVGINYWGVVHGIKAFLPAMARRGSGHIVNTASLAGLVPSPSLGLYSSTKFAIVGLSEALRIELKPAGIGVTVVCPGPIRTNIVNTGRYADSEEGEQSKRRAIDLFQRRGKDPDRVARAVLRGIRRNRAIVPVGWEAWAAWYAMRLSVPLAERLTGIIMRRYL